jgi:hypothetical protein
VKKLFDLKNRGFFAFYFPEEYTTRSTSIAGGWEKETIHIWALFLASETAHDMEVFANQMSGLSRIVEWKYGILKKILPRFKVRIRPFLKQIQNSIVSHKISLRNNFSTFIFWN